MSKITIEKINDDDVEEVTQIIRNHYIPDEPLCVSLNVNGDPQSALEIVQYSVSDLNDGLKLKAVNEEGKIIGICINSLVREKIFRAPLDSNKISSNSLKLRKFVETIDERSKIESFLAKHNKSLFIKFLAIIPEYRGQGIASKLLEKSRDLAERIGCTFIFVYCTNHFTATAAKKLGFRCIHSLDYSDYKDGDEIVIKATPPHTSLTVYSFNIN